MNDSVKPASALSSFSFEPIAFVESPYKEKFGTPRQPGLVEESRGAIVLRDGINPDALDGLSEYSHAWAIFVFHENQAVREGRRSVKTKVHPPRLEGKAVGVFSTRSPHRPNAIGLSLLRIERIEGRRLLVGGLDLIDGTPILDIKPYLPTIEALPEAHEGWSADLASKSVDVQWSEKALMDLHGSDTAKAAIEKILELDIRPVAYRGSHENPDPYTDVYGFRYEDWNVVFRMLPPEDSGGGARVKKAVIERLEPWNRPTATKNRS